MLTSPHVRGRPVTNRERTFRPDYLMFAPLYQCNLTCAHCSVPIELPDRLDIPTALRFLEDANAQGIRTLGLTGGEPFLYPEFVQSVCRRAVELGFRFDRIQTNGVWHRDAAHLEEVLRPLADLGYSGKLGLSVDKFHGQHTARAAEFCRVAVRLFGRDNVVSLSYASRRPDVGLEPAQALAQELDAVIDWSPVLRRYLLVAPDLTMTLGWNHLAPVERAEKLSGAWDGVWFEEDYCEGPGQALIVNPRGEVKPCCGFASDLDELTIGNIHHHTAAEVIERGRSHPYVGKVFRDGLTAVRDELLARDPEALPGATSNHCFFCWYVLAKQLVALPAAAHGRLSLPLTAARPEATSLLMSFDGRTVFLRREPTPELLAQKGRVYVVNVVGPALAEPPCQLTWAEYQAWLDQLRATGYTLTTHEFTPCLARTLQKNAINGEGSPGTAHERCTNSG